MTERTVAERIKDDRDSLRYLLQAAVRRGISLRRLNGWEPKQTTEYVYDDAGLLVRTVTTTEPEWDDDERDMALQLDAYEAQCCSGCGGFLPETTRAENEDSPTHVAALCHSCVSKKIAREGIAHAHPEALLFTTHLNSRKPAA